MILINQINYDLENKLGLEKEEFKLAGVLILFNNLYKVYLNPKFLLLDLLCRYFGNVYSFI